MLTTIPKWNYVGKGEDILLVIENRSYVLKGDFHSILFNKRVSIHIINPELRIVRLAMGC